MEKIVQQSHYAIDKITRRELKRKFNNLVVETRASKRMREDMNIMTPTSSAASLQDIQKYSCFCSMVSIPDGWFTTDSSFIISKESYLDDKLFSLLNSNNIIRMKETNGKVIYEQRQFQSDKLGVHMSASFDSINDDFKPWITFTSYRKTFSHPNFKNVLLNQEYIVYEQSRSTIYELRSNSYTNLQLALDSLNRATSCRSSVLEGLYQYYPEVYEKLDSSMVDIYKECPPSMDFVLDGINIKPLSLDDRNWSVIRKSGIYHDYKHMSIAEACDALEKLERQEYDDLYEDE
eukprot:NODE_255_length_12751_cov_0.188587.p3 type:complete len:291 gc:universal NODE_255_length_12751_cov_0.188587:9632-10504(+)